jgi:exopolysaccharide biosynthesis polyprenyl glycosylphosphotransferase
MNAIERSALVDGLELHDELKALVSERTLGIVERRRKTAVVKGRGWLVRRLLLMADVVGLSAALLLAEWLSNGHAKSGTLGSRAEILVFVATLPAWVVIAKLYGLYDRDEERTDHSTADDVGGVFHMVTICTWLFWAGAQVTHLAHPAISKVLIFWAAAVALVSIGRAIARFGARRKPAYVQNTVIVGAGEVGQVIAKKLLQHPEYGINLVGFVDANPKERRDDLEDLVLLGDLSRLPAIIRLFEVERAIVAFSRHGIDELLDLVRELNGMRVQVDIVPRLFDVVGTGIDLHTVEGVPLLGLRPLSLSRSSALLKRSVDLALSVVGLVLLAPLFVLVAVLIKLDSNGPAFFRQVRMGSRDRPFRIWKFRTMTADADERKPEVAHLNKHLENGGDPRMFKIPGDPRITRMGRWLRRYSVDELPQLWNVARGDMSLVGPRPLILEEDDHIEGWGRRRLDLRPGMTGLWQVFGRSAIPFAEMVRLDYIYISDWSLLSDFRIILRTLPLVARSSRGAI